MLENLPPLIDVIRRHELSTRKALGQHFLLDERIVQRIAQCAGNVSDATVIEVGPGPGGLTRALLHAGAEQVIAVEKDARCLPALAEIAAAANGRLQVLEADALEADIRALGHGPRVIVANLPYNVATPLLIGWLKAVHHDPRAIRSMTLMFQKEVATRLTAKPGGKDYGRLSVITQWLCEAVNCFDLPPGAFSPPPKVDSRVVRLTVKADATPKLPFEAVEKVLAAAFGQRRKMLGSALKTLGADTAALLEKAGIDGKLRAEQVEVAGLLKLAEAYYALNVRF